MHMASITASGWSVRRYWTTASVDASFPMFPEPSKPNKPTRGLVPLAWLVICLSIPLFQPLSAGSVSRRAARDDGLDVDHRLPVRDGRVVCHRVVRLGAPGHPLDEVPVALTLLRGAERRAVHHQEVSADVLGEQPRHRVAPGVRPL